MRKNIKKILFVATILVCVVTLILIVEKKRNIKKIDMPSSESANINSYRLFTVENIRKVNQPVQAKEIPRKGTPLEKKSTFLRPEEQGEALTTLSFSYQGESFIAKLVYPGNNFEGFFTINDSQIKAYTVYPPSGPFTNQDYYYLEVLRSVATYQLWVWNGTQTSNNITVNNWNEVPNQPHIPVPVIPGS